MGLLAPEMFTSTGYGRQVDMWSLGCVLYELVALKLPFEEKTMHKLAVAIMQAEPRPMQPTVSTELKSLVKMMLKKNPKHRPRARRVLGGAVGTFPRRASRKGGRQAVGISPRRTRL